MSIFTSVTYKDIIPKGVNILSLDVSKTSTGWVRVLDGKIEHGVFEIKVHSDNGVLELVEFKNFLKSITEGVTFDFICIEDIIGSINFKTAKILYRLNLTVDDLVHEGVIVSKELIRIDNKRWKKHLKQLSGYRSTVRGYNDDKKMVRDCLHLLGFNNEVKQDIYDACGVLLGVLYEKTFSSKENTKTKKISLEKYKMKNFGDEDSAFLYIDKLKNKGNIIVEDISDRSISLEQFWKNSSYDLDNSVILVRLRGDQFGRVLLKKKLVCYEDNFLVIGG